MSKIENESELLLELFDGQLLCDRKQTYVKEEFYCLNCGTLLDNYRNFCDEDCEEDYLNNRN